MWLATAAVVVVAAASSAASSPPASPAITFETPCVLAQFASVTVGNFTLPPVDVVHDGASRDIAYYCAWNMQSLMLEWSDDGLAGKLDLTFGAADDDEEGEEDGDGDEYAYPYYYYDTTQPVASYGLIRASAVLELHPEMIQDVYWFNKTSGQFERVNVTRSRAVQFFTQWTEVTPVAVAGAGNSYKCRGALELELKSAAVDDELTLTVTLEDFWLDAFRDQQGAASGTFREPVRCKTDVEAAVAARSSWDDFFDLLFGFLKN